MDRHQNDLREKDPSHEILNQNLALVTIMTTKVD